MTSLFASSLNFQLTVRSLFSAVVPPRFEVKSFHPRLMMTLMRSVSLLSEVVSTVAARIAAVVIVAVIVANT